MSCARLATLPCVAALLFAAPLCAQAAAEPPSAAAEDAGTRAVALGQQALRDFEQGHFPEALRGFREADASFHSPVFTLYEGRSLRRLGRLVEARAAFERVLAESLAEDAPESWSRAHVDARTELTSLLAELPASTPPLADSPSQVALTPDGQPAPERLPSAAPVAPAAQARSTLPGWLLVGGGGAALAAAGVVGVLALNKAADARAHLPSGCQGEVCLNRDKASVDESFAGARRLAVVADVLWLSGAVAAATGVTWLVIVKRSGQRTEVSVLPGGIVVSSRF